MQHKQRNSLFGVGKLVFEIRNHLGRVEPRLLGVQFPLFNLIVFTLSLEQQRLGRQFGGVKLVDTFLQIINRVDVRHNVRVKLPVSLHI